MLVCGPPSVSEHLEPFPPLEVGPWEVVVMILFPGTGQTSQRKTESKQTFPMKILTLTSFLASGNFCHLLITFANSLNPDPD